MFTLHERTRLFLCRTGFLILCLAPTLFVGGAAVHYRSTSYLEARREEWCAVLSDKLGLEVRIDSLSYPLWNMALLEGVSLTDSETDSPILTARYVEVGLVGGRWEVTAGQPEVNAGALPLLVELANHRLLRGQAMKFPPIDFEATQLTVRNGEVAQSFEHVVAELQTTDSGKRMGGTFRVAGVASDQPLEFSIERDRGQGNPKTTWRLSTAGTALPCGTLGPLWPWLNHLGNDATFNGQAAFEQSAGIARTEIAGTFASVDLDRLVSDHFPHHRLSGQAEIALDPLVMQNGSIEQIEGTLQTHGGGTVSRSLLTALATKLDLAPAKPPQLLAERLVNYTHLAFGFRLDHEGLIVKGYADPVRQGVIMAGAKHDSLLEESSRPVIPATLLVPLMNPGSGAQVPTTREARSLFDLLPLPSLVSAEDEAEPKARIRLHQD